MVYMEDVCCWFCIFFFSFHSFFPSISLFLSFLAKYWDDLHLTHNPCNFHIKEVIGEGGLAVYTKRSWIHLFMLTLMHNTIFTKKKVIGAGGLTALAKRIGFTSFTFDSGII